MGRETVYEKRNCTGRKKCGKENINVDDICLTKASSRYSNPGSTWDLLPTLSVVVALQPTMSIQYTVLSLKATV